MNGRLARRIHRAAYQVLLSGTGAAPSKGNTHKKIVKTLKREYHAVPYHKRDLSNMGIRSLSHREQEKRWNMYNDQRLERFQELAQTIESSPVMEDDFYDDHSWLKTLRRK